ncbi:MAG: DNA-directed DNA polymerase II small subunit [Thermoplasmata archaeon]|nr:DNA-directed DNA polymerase II small subunit [Thermoplasmata archaeon]
MKRRVLELLSKHGVLIEPDAADFLCRQPNPLELVETQLLISERNSSMIITLGQLQNILSSKNIAEMNQINILTKISKPPMEPKINVLKDITGNSTCIGDINSFVKLFRSRYKTVKKLLLRRRELLGAASISKARRSDGEIRLVGMVSEVRTTKNGHRLIRLEDEDDSILVLAIKNSPAFSDTIVSDEVIGVIGKVAKKGDMIVADEIIRPDVPVGGGMKKNDSDAWAIFVGDIHVGSDMFLENQWNSFIDWLKTADEAKNVRYMIMPGDLVDGIGIYPEQEDELRIDDIYRQYELLAEYLKEIRDDISIIACPGNHDAVRLAEPQPSLPESFGKFFDSNVSMVGNPAQIELEGRNILIYHGRSIDDWIAAIPGLSYDKPLDVMKEMLRRRHLAPIYGERTAIAPEEKDYLVIEDIPDIFVTGHVHHAGMGDYRGVIMINASTWQSQTAFQRMHNHMPDPCKAFMVHLGIGKARVVKFT